ncbi:esterase-like activity of phytase family protein [Aliterella atlantica]|uniref:esterase-like activity of phytase family protein n=1 Tax=Aliterella atlantica TaxID=1827278 RepID=UPI0005D410D0|nr:esterase-like activity of phytase family protein [Aliterella atlantica]
MSKIIQFLPSFKVTCLCLLSGFVGILITNMPSLASVIKDIEFIGQAAFTTDTQVQNTQVGGLSGITYNPNKNVFYSVSDDRSQNNPARFYTLTIDVNERSLGAIKFTGVTFLKNQEGQKFPALSLDPEGIAFTNKGSVFISSEGDGTAANLTNPFVREFSLTGKQLQALPIPPKYLPTKQQTRGIRNNLAFESLTIVPSQKYLFTATENALFQDGAVATVNNGSLSRILRFNLDTNKPAAEYLYIADKVAEPPTTANGLNNNGLVDLLAIDDKHLISLERSFSAGTGTTIKLYEVSLKEAEDISNIASLKTVDIKSIKAVKKKLILNFDKLNLALDNIEGLTFGPNLTDGRRSLIVVSDNNFSPTQKTQFIVFSVGVTPKAYNEQR